MDYSGASQTTFIVTPPHAAYLLKVSSVLLRCIDIHTKRLDAFVSGRLAAVGSICRKAADGEAAEEGRSCRC